MYGYLIYDTALQFTLGKGCTTLKMVLEKVGIYGGERELAGEERNGFLFSHQTEKSIPDDYVCKCERQLSNYFRKKKT